MTLQQEDKSSEILAFRLRKVERAALDMRRKPDESQSDLLRRAVKYFLVKTRPITH
jgi:hypothetical protein